MHPKIKHLFNLFPQEAVRDFIRTRTEMFEYLPSHLAVEYIRKELKI